MIVSLWPPVIFIKSCKDIPAFAAISESQNVKEIRSKFRIISLDDEEFIHKKSLAELGYNVGYYSGIQEISPGDDGQIFLCDILGLSPQSSDQGAYGMRELRRRYPVAPIVAYTHLTAADRRYQAARDAADLIIRKHASIDNLTEALDGYIAEINNPRAVWKRINKVLRSWEVDTKRIAIIEHYFVTAFNKKSMSIFDKGVRRTLATDADDLLEGVARVMAKGALSFAGKVVMGGA